MPREIKNKALIIEMYMAGEKIKTIAEATGISMQTLPKHIQRLKQRGEIPPGRRKEILPRDVEVKPKKELPKPKTKKQTLDELAKVWNEEPVKCCTSVSKKCIWGMCQTQSLSNVSANLCNYCFINSHSRGCPYEECHRFVPITKNTPRPVVKFDGINLRVKGE